MSSKKQENCNLIGGRLKFLRKNEGLRQKEFARILGVKQQHISLLEKNKSNPSNHLLVSMCRAFRVNMAWLRDGTGDIYDIGLRLTPKGNRVMEETETRLRTPTRAVAINEIAQLMGFDLDDPKPKKLSGDEFHDLMDQIIRLVDEGDAGKISAVTNFLKLIKSARK